MPHVTEHTPKVSLKAIFWSGLWTLRSAGGRSTEAGLAAGVVTGDETRLFYHVLSPTQLASVKN